VQDAHPVIKAMIAIVIHLVGITTMLHEGFSDDFGEGGFVYGHYTNLGTTGFIAI
jgi:hypothetical protein